MFIIVSLLSSLFLFSYGIQDIIFPKYRQQIAHFQWMDCITGELFLQSYNSSTGEMFFDIRDGSLMCQHAIMNYDIQESQKYCDFHFIFNREFSKADKLFVYINGNKYAITQEITNKNSATIRHYVDFQQIAIDFSLQNSLQSLGLLNILLNTNNTSIYNSQPIQSQFLDIIFKNNYQIFNNINFESYWRTINQKIQNGYLIFQGELNISVNEAPLMDVKLFLYDENILDTCLIQYQGNTLKYECEKSLDYISSLRTVYVYFYMLEYKIILYFPGFLIEETPKNQKLISQVDNNYQTQNDVQVFQEITDIDNVINVIYEPFLIVQDANYIKFKLLAKGIDQCNHNISEARIQILMDDSIQLTCHKGGCLEYEESLCQFQLNIIIDKLHNYYLILDAYLEQDNSNQNLISKFTINKLYINDILKDNTNNFWLISILFLTTLIIPFLSLVLVSFISQIQKKCQPFIHRQLQDMSTFIELPSQNQMSIQPSPMNNRLDQNQYSQPSPGL